MASSDNPFENHRVHNDSAKTFVNFRCFADEQLSHFLHNFLGLNSISTASTSTSQSYSLFDYIWRQESRHRRHAESLEAAGICNIIRTALDEGCIILREELGISRCPFGPTDEELPQTEKVSSSDLAWEDCLEEHLIDQDLMERCLTACSNVCLPVDLDNAFELPPVHSATIRVSPLQQERQKPFRNELDKGRNAFGYPQAATREKSMSEKYADKSGQSWFDSIEMKFLRYDGRRISQERWQPGKLFAMPPVPAIREPSDDAEEDEVAELNLYERFLCGQQPSPYGHHVPSRNNPSSPTPTSEFEPPGILSTLTTSERSKHPDGSIHTKVVLKKRFFDGREESTEMVHTAYHSQKSNPKIRSPAKAATNDGISKGASDVEAKEKDRKNGWFWA